ncbi:hypothetical protein [Roseateles saccharophilus]|uniref:Bro-N domain-containing protein n=1 Tax=Roseateles saccharophilus TaxID=304 RepID=A0A4R3VJ46_ROSSA|nr:hypothetical protein [Roseateles saccharophilus]MDG0832840.1 hypothetical protein [Roseateles saccharophilus]TCV03799.1 hypothetical protein EV671_100260 [Roseateles saccharophilus]
MPRREPPGFDAAAHERHHWWRSLLLKLALCSGVSALLWWSSGWAGLLVSVMLWARALAGDLMALLETAWRSLRQLAFRPVQGHFYQFKGQRIRVVDDDLDAHRWIALQDLATALGAPMPAAVFRRRQPQALRERPDGVYLLDQAALAWLGEQRSERAGRLRLWVEREVWYPARGRRAGYRQKGAPGNGLDTPEG